jgi:hypothetical protein
MEKGTYPLIVDNVDTLNGTEPAELVVQVALPGLNGKTKDTNHLRRGSLLLVISPRRPVVVAIPSIRSGSVIPRGVVPRTVVVSSRGRRPVVVVVSPGRRSVDDVAGGGKHALVQKR